MKTSASRRSRSCPKRTQEAQPPRQQTPSSVPPMSSIAALDDPTRVLIACGLTAAYAHEVVAQADVDRNAILSEPDYMEEYCGDQLAGNYRYPCDASTLRAALLQLGFQPALIDKDYMPYVRSLSPLYLSHRNTSNYGKMIIEGRFERSRCGELEVSSATSIRSRI